MLSFLEEITIPHVMNGLVGNARSLLQHTSNPRRYIESQRYPQNRANYLLLYNFVAVVESLAG